MDKDTLKALKASIRKWNYLMSGKAEDEPDCALCKRFIDQEDSCENCPIAISSGESGCENTPYFYWQDASVYGSYSFLIQEFNSPEVLTFAQLEREFLVSLLPKSEQKGIYAPWRIPK